MGMSFHHLVGGSGQGPRRHDASQRAARVGKGLHMHRFWVPQVQASELAPHRITVNIDITELAQHRIYIYIYIYICICICI
jgi:hypothetical protein